jgi:hydrogenase maturation protease
MSSTSDKPGAAVVVGVGNSWAGDDAAGVLVARSLRGRVPDGVTVFEHEGEPTALLDAWSGARIAIVVDAATGTGPPGTTGCFDATAAPLPAHVTARSTHALSPAEAIELGRGIGRLPARVFVVTIEGERFAAGADPHPAVKAGIDRAAEEVLELLRVNY